MRKVECLDEDDLQPEYVDWSDGVRGLFAGRRPLHQITVKIEVAPLSDGRWRAQSAYFPEAIGYGADADSALDEAEERVAEIVRARAELGEIPPTGLNFAVDYQ